MSKTKTKLLISVIGPTAAGKTNYAIEIAEFFKTEIVSADSRQFYRELNIGTAKPTDAQMKRVKHHFINSHSISMDYSVGKYEKEAILLIEKLFKQHDVVVLVGGSGLFCKAIWEGIDEMPLISDDLRQEINRIEMESGLDELLSELKKSDPQYFEAVDRKNPQRIKRAIEVIRATGKPYSSFRLGVKSPRAFTSLKIGMAMTRDLLYQRIDERMDEMIKGGLFEEAKSLYPVRGLGALQTVGYTEIFDYIDDKYEYTEAVRLLKRNSRRYAKRQLTWFGRDEEINWLDPLDYEQGIELAKSQLDA